MPWASKKQQRFGNSPSGKTAMGESAVDEFNEATKGQYGSLPMRAPKATPSRSLLTRFKPPKKGK
jgi:hypothetical protein